MANTDLTTLVIDAHGGTDRWDKVASIEADLNLTGVALARKGYGGHHQPVATIDIKAAKVVFQGLPTSDRDDRWTYTPQRAWIERQDGTVTASRDDPYQAFVDHTAATPWDDLHLLTFSGYAFYNYFTFPFHLRWPDFHSREVDPHEENGETWRVLEVTYPEHYLSHQKTQLYYFDDAFMLRRIDYAPLAMKLTAAHYCFDAQESSGLKFPMLRRVVLRKPKVPMVNGDHALGGWAWLSGPSAFLLDFRKMIVRDEIGTDGLASKA